MTVGQIIEEGLNAHHFFRKGDPRTQEYVMKTMENCGLAPYMIHRYPINFLVVNGKESVLLVL